VPRLDILLRRNSGFSRRQITGLLRSGAVVDERGASVTDGRLQIEPSDLPRTIAVLGEPLTLHHRVDVLLHKPHGVVTAHRDDRHPTAYDLLRGAPLHPELRAVGRLDLDTTGLLLWTTDGALLHRLTHPRWAIPRTYHVATAGPWSEPPAELELDDGHRPDIVELAPLAADATHPALLRPAAPHALATLTITSGRFHEVKRIFVALGTHVLGLCRVAYGPVTLPTTLAAGSFTTIDLRDHFRGIHPVR
jgi:16S rRNA pseudouridine516 synthase